MVSVLKTSEPGSIPVKSAIGDIGSAVGWIGIAAFDTQIQFRDFRKAGKVDAREPSRDIWAKKRSDLVVFRESLGIKRHPVPKSGNTITEIQSRSPRSR